MLIRKLTITPLDSTVANMINVTKKKAQIAKIGLGDAALMYLDQQNKQDEEELQKREREFIIE